MPECVSCRLYLHVLLDAWENFDITHDRRSRAISNFPTHFEVKYSRKEAPTAIIFYMYCTHPSKCQCILPIDRKLRFHSSVVIPRKMSKAEMICCEQKEPNT